MNIQEREISLLSEDELDAVAGGWKNDPPTTHNKLVEFGSEIAATKAMGPVAEYLY